MQKLVKITFVGETKKGVSKNTGKEWALTDVDVKWTEAQPGREPYEQSCVGTVRGWIDKIKAEEYIKQEREILVTMYVKVRMWENRHFTSVELYLPKDFMLEAEPL